MILLRIALIAASLLLPAAPAAAQTSFLTGIELGQRLQRNVVRIRSLDLREHGFGLIVGAAPRHLWIATAAHVVQPRPGRAPADLDRSNRRIEVEFCIGDVAGSPIRGAEPVDGFDSGGADIALLRVLRPTGFEIDGRAAAPEASIAPRQPAWLLGQEQTCGVGPRSGSIAATRDGRDNLRIEFPGVRGGASGGPVISAYGIVGVLTDAEDLTVTVYSLAALQARVRAHAADIWQLTEAGNIPPGDPRAAEIDLAETLNQYLFSARNLQLLLLQPEVPQQRFVDFANKYNAVVMGRWVDARERHDGSLQRHWEAPVFEQWRQLRDKLWQLHLKHFLALNADSKQIFDRRRAPPPVQQRMRELEPELVALQQDIEQFLLALAQRRKS